MTRTPHAPLLALTLSLVTALCACGSEPGGFNPDDVQTGCDATHAKVGHAAELSNLFHEVSGTVVVVDDCTLEIRDFHYDGGGLDVRVTGAVGGDFENGIDLSENILSEVYEGETLTLSLPSGTSLDDFDQLSIWCLAAGVSFGDGELAPLSFPASMPANAE